MVGDGPERRWEESNREAIARYNHRVAEEGLLSDDAGLLGSERSTTRLPPHITNVGPSAQR
jgi:hypothetical protein